MGRTNRSAKDASVLGFFGLVFALAAPFWLIGKKKLPLPVKLPGSALAFVTPVVAAAILTHREQGLSGVRALLWKTFDYPKVKNKAWYLPILLLNPLISFVSYRVMPLARLPLPAEPRVPLRRLPAYFAMFFVSGACEELGWQGYAYERLKARWGWLRASLLLGIAWAAVHIIPDVQNGQTGRWIFWHRLGSIANRVLMGWLSEHTGGSVFGSILYHDMSNVSWALFPNNGSHYNPKVTAIFTVAAAIGAALEGKRLR